MWGSRRGIKDQKSIDIINTARANKNFFKKSFYVIPAFSDFFFFSKLAFIWLRVFLFPFSSVFFTFLTFFFIWLLCSKKSYKMIQKRERSFKWCITNNNFSSTTHSLNRKRRQSGFYFCFVLRVTLSETFTKTRKKKTSKMTHLWVTFFSWSHDVVRCCGNCPKYSFCFFCFFFEVQSFMVKASFIFIARRTFLFFFDFLIFGKIYNKVRGILLLQMLQKDLRNNHFLTEDMERLRVVV